MLALTVESVFGQTVSSTILGTLTDPTNAIVPNAKLTLTLKADGAFRTVNSNDAGLFRFLDLPAGEYSLRIEAKGFKAQNVTSIALAATETRDLGQIALQLGSAAEVVTVTAQVTPVQTSSSERGGVVDQSQINDVALKGRDAFGYLALMPGIVDTNTSRDTSNALSMYQISINGAMSNNKNVMIDGVTSMDWGGNYSTYMMPNLETIAEIRVVESIAPAEFGRQSGGNVNIITKSGGREFHGSGYWSHRNEDMNANSFFNNMADIPRPIYRYAMYGYSIGGPIYIPKLFNPDRQKLFFFVSQEFTGQKTPSTTSTANMPTQLERDGDYSNSRDALGNVITITDSSTGAPFPNNVVPTARINSTGQAILNLFPLPNGYVNPAPGQQYTANFLENATGYNDRRSDMARIDYLLKDNMNLVLRAGRDVNNIDTPFESGPGLGGRVTYQPGYVFTARLIHTLSPTKVNEFSFGLGHNNYGFYHTESDADYFRTAALDPPTLRSTPLSFCTNPNPQSCFNLPKPYLPAMEFAGGALPGAVSFTPDTMTPYKNSNDNTVLTDNFSWVLRNHSIKTGVYVEKNVKTEPDNGVYYMGNYNFGAMTNNPLSLGNGYTNALLGAFDTYTEASTTLMPHFYGWNVEGFVQDSWRVGRRLTIDLGVRWDHMGPYQDDKGTLSGFYPQLYSAAQAPRLYWPAVVGGQPVAIDPVTGTTTYASLVDTMVPGSGNVADGMHVNGLTGKGDFYSYPFLIFTPRVGFAWNVFGDGKTAIRGGFGQFSNLYNSGQLANSQYASPPLQYNPTVYYSTFGQVPQAAASAAMGPTSGSGMYGNQKVENSINVNLTIQREIGFNTVVDIAYVGNFDRNAPQAVEINPVPLGAYANSKNIVNGSEVPADLLRTAFPGMGDLTYQSDSASTLNYHALQIQAQRRLTHGLQFGASYSYSKALGVQGTDPYHNQREWWYGPTQYDRRNNLAINYTYYLPNAGSHLGPMKHVLNNWILSGITSFQSGAPATPTCTSYNPGVANSDPSLTGSGSYSPPWNWWSTSAGARCQEIGDPNAYQKSFFTNFNTSAFTLAAPGTFGNIGLGILREPAWTNFDASLEKRVHLGNNEKRVLRLRLEAYNIFNHAEFNSMGTSMALVGTSNVNTTYGELTGTRPPRQISTTVRFEF